MRYYNSKNQKKKAKEEYNIVSSSGFESPRAIFDVLRTGENIGEWSLRYGAENKVSCTEKIDFEGYARSCKWKMVRRSFYLHIKKGWHVEHVGGLLTFLRGPLRREGQACAWVVQGRAIADLTTVSGYLVRGEHIEAKSLAEAKRISAQHRSLRCARLLNQRKHAAERAKAKVNGTLRITFADSLAAGNCRPGTTEFKLKYEEAIGRKVRNITIADLRKYAKEFGVSYYAEMVISYVLHK